MGDTFFIQGELSLSLMQHTGTDVTPDICSTFVVGS